MSGLPPSIKCKACGRPLIAKKSRYLVTFGNVVEFLCWKCRVWSETGYVMPERRA